MTTIYDLKNDEMDTIDRAVWSGDFATLELLAGDYAKRDDMENAWRLKSVARQIKASLDNMDEDRAIAAEEQDVTPSSNRF